MWRREAWNRATLEEGRLAPTPRWHLGHHHGRLIAYSLVFEDPSLIRDPDLDTDSDGSGCGPRVEIGSDWGGSPLEGPVAELEWDPTGDVGWLGALRNRRVWTPGSPCEVCGRAEPLAVWSVRPRGPPRSSFHTRDQNQQSPRDGTVQIPLGSEDPKEEGVLAREAQPRRTHRTLLFLLLLFLLGVACLLPPPGGPPYPPPRLPGSLHLVLRYVNGPPPT
ncbi:nesprin-4 isoform X2 [Macrotis lagotis]|uniref:nesprin-4 isoform X2 n=1 Tax=Macrotis lagotis TaxID=92651 RepID=UPI003D69C3AC